MRLFWATFAVFEMVFAIYHFVQGDRVAFGISWAGSIACCAMARTYE